MEKLSRASARGRGHRGPLGPKRARDARPCPRGAPRGRAAAPPAFPAPARSPPGDLPPRNRPIYYVRPAPPDHAALGKNKTAGRRLAVFAKHRVWSRGRGSNVVDGPVSWRRPCREPDPRRSEGGKQSFSDRFPANCTGRWPVVPFPSSFEPLFCTYSANPSASKDFEQSHQAAQHR